MLRIKYIFTSILFFLLVGINANARAAADSKELIEKSTQKDNSGDESQHEPEEQITQLDFFGAFSLVNVQLQWRDLSADLNEEESDSDELWNSKEVFVDAVELFTDAGSNALPSPVVISTTNFFVPFSVSRVNNKVDLNFNPSEQNAQTIAYIQNCGTYLKS
jgi:hypothetical protein